MMEPDAYREGHIPFLDATIYLDSHPLIPRVETEFWIEIALREINAHESPRVLDLFSGSGCIGVAVLMGAPRASVDFGELDAKHLPTIRKNIELNGIQPERARTIQTDVWNNVNDSYDFILANPPYLSQNRIERIQDSVLNYEPNNALFAEHDGYEFIEKTLKRLESHLRPLGTLYIEHEPEHAERLLSDGHSLGFAVQNHVDQYNVLRFSTVTRV